MSSVLHWSRTCPVGEREDHAAIGDPAHVPDRGDAAVVGVVLRTQVLQLQYLCLPLQLRPNQHWYANVCENTTPKYSTAQSYSWRGEEKGQTAPEKGHADKYVEKFEESEAV